MKKTLRALFHALTLVLFASPSIVEARPIPATGIRHQIARSVVSSRLHLAHTLVPGARTAPKTAFAPAFHGLPGRYVFSRVRLSPEELESRSSEHDALLRKLGISVDEPTMATVPSKQKLLATEQGRLGLGETIKNLQTKPYLTRKVLFTPAERDTVAHITVDHGYNILKDPNVHLSDAGYQKRVDGIFSTLSQRLQKELAVDPKSFGGHIAVVGGGKADSFNAVTLSNGSVIVHQTLVDVADKVGAATAAAHTQTELIKNLAMVAVNHYDGTANTPEAKRYSDAFLAMVIGHEMTHGMKFHGAIGSPAGEPRGHVGPMTRARETVADGGGVELATRSGFSPLGELSGPLYFSLLEAVNGMTKPDKDDSHPAGIDRYAFTYRYLERRLNAPRTIYDGTHPHAEGAPLMTDAMRKEFGELPKPEQVKQIAERIAAQVKPEPAMKRLRVYLVPRARGIALQ